MPVPTSLPSIIEDSLNIKPLEVYQSRDYVLLYENEDDILALEPDENKLKGIDLGHGGIVCTALGREVDFVSRFLLREQAFSRIRLLDQHIAH